MSEFKTDASYVGPVEVMGPTHIIAVENGKIYQLWYASNTRKTEWRELPTLEEAKKQYGG